MCGDYNLHREKRYVEVDVRLLLMARSDLLPSITTKAISMESTVFWLSGVAHRAWREGAVLHLHNLRAEAESLA